MSRDANGRAQVEAPSADKDIANKTYADGLVSSATNAPNANSLMKRDANGRAKVAAPTIHNELARLEEILKAGAFALMQSYTTPGTFTFTAPDLYGDGRTYDAYAIIDGAGASGAAACIKYGSAGAVNSANGGGSGCRRIVKVTITPGVGYAVVVGVGGAAVTVSQGPQGVSTPTITGGNNGGSSSFNGNSASGGGGGGTASSTASGVIETSASIPVGGQRPDSNVVILKDTFDRATAPCGGIPPRFYIGTYSATCFDADNGNKPFEFINPFVPSEKRLSAGGAAAYRSGYVVWYQAVEEMSDGIASAGKMTKTNTDADLTVACDSATSPGSGGGGAFAVLTVSTNTPSICTAISGKGADGQVRIYARRVPA
jgi:hypothetical protein